MCVYSMIKSHLSLVLMTLLLCKSFISVSLWEILIHHKLWFGKFILHLQQELHKIHLEMLTGFTFEITAFVTFSSK